MNESFTYYDELIDAVMLAAEAQRVEVRAAGRLAWSVWEPAASRVLAGDSRGGLTLAEVSAFLGIGREQRREQAAAPGINHLSGDEDADQTAGALLRDGSWWVVVAGGDTTADNPFVHVGDVRALTGGGPWHEWVEVGGGAGGAAFAALLATWIGETRALPVWIDPAPDADGPDSPAWRTEIAHLLDIVGDRLTAAGDTRHQRPALRAAAGLLGSAARSLRGDCDGRHTDKRQQ